MSLWRRMVAEAHRRSLWQVLGIYLVGSWIGFQVVLALVDGIGLPSWLPGFAAALFVIGLPIVLARRSKCCSCRRDGVCWHLTLPTRGTRAK